MNATGKHAPGPMTSGRYMVANVDRARERGHGATMGYFGTLSDACEFAHTFGSSLHPVGVYDSHVRRGDAGIDVQLVHVTHGNVRWLVAAAGGAS